MNLIKAYCAGVALPSVILPFVVFTYLRLENTDVLAIPFVVAIPFIWGIWNIIHRKFLETNLSSNENISYLISGAILGLIVAFIGVFFFHATEVVGLNQTISWLPFVIAPLVYAILWATCVKYLNNLLKP